MTRETGKLAPGLTPSNHDLTPTTMTVRETWSGKRDHDGGSTDDVERVTSRVQTQSTRPTAGDNVGTAAARTAGRGLGKARSLAATMCQRRPSDQLTPSHRLDVDARERQHVSSPVRQLRLTTTGLLSFTHSAQLRELNSIYTVSRLQFINSKRFTPLFTTLYTVTLSLSRFSTQSDSIAPDALVHAHLPGHMKFSRRPY